MTRIDAHQHFWRVDRADYGWLTPQAHPKIARDFLPADLEPLLAATVQTPDQQAETLLLASDAFDGLGRFDEAFAAAAKGKAVQRAAHAQRAASREGEVEKLSRLAAWFESADPAPWQTPAPASATIESEPDTHVFLVGFPRSGTTLLEQVLASHPDIVPLEEQPTLSEPMAHFFNREEGLEELMSASEAELEPWRERYWAKVAGYLGPVGDKVFVDKQPSLTAFLPLIKRLFPHARIVFNIRDPRDVILSCFRHGFVMNANMYEYTDILKLANLYNLTMECASVYFEKLNLSVYRHNHEAFITDFEPKTRDLCAFLGVEYDERMQDFVETARNREINTPSRDQVRAGLNASGVGYWRNYAAQLREPAEIVKPWVTAYGYPE